jgi:hypothetical protein
MVGSFGKSCFWGCLVGWDGKTAGRFDCGDHIFPRGKVRFRSGAGAVLDLAGGEPPLGAGLLAGSLEEGVAGAEALGARTSRALGRHAEISLGRTLFAVGPYRRIGIGLAGGGSLDGGSD